MSYDFHEIKNIVQHYLDDLPARSPKRSDHVDHLHQIFIHFRYYNILFNLDKCIFVVDSGCLLGFIISSYGIKFDPLKVKAIIKFHPPNSLIQLQILQWKENFLICFVANYAEITKGLMRLLKKGVPFIWDEQAQRYFNRLK